MAVDSNKSNLVVLILELLLMTLLVLVATLQFEPSGAVGRGDLKVDPIRRTRVLHWFDDAVGVAEKIYDGSWDFQRFKAGEGTFIYIEIGSFDTRTFDGGGYYVIGIQLPHHVWPGESFELDSLAAQRLEQTDLVDGEMITTTRIKPGELTAFQYSNPAMGWMPVDVKSAATIAISKTRPDSVLVKLELNAPLTGSMRRLQLFQEFKLERKEAPTE